MRQIQLFFLLVGLTSCSSIYENNFDCQPCRGVPCTSVTEIESMIVETSVGENVFIGRGWGENPPSNTRNRRVYFTPCEKTPGYFVNLEGEESCWTP